MPRLNVNGNSKAQQTSKQTSTKKQQKQQGGSSVFDKLGDNNGVVDSRDLKIIYTKIKNTCVALAVKSFALFFGKVTKEGNYTTYKVSIGEYTIELKEDNKGNFVSSSFVKKSSATEKSTQTNTSSSPQYKKVYDIVEYQLVKRTPNPKNKKTKCKSINDLPENQREQYRKKASEITNMVIEKCKKYNIEDLAPVIADMLGFETGGYNFVPKVMEHPGSKYKGVMQCDLTTCQIIYGEGPGKGEHDKYCKQDKTRIAQLKKKYPNATALYKAIQKDVGLGIEVGILALKVKIGKSNGSVAGGISKYCGNQYKCTSTGVPSNIDISKRT